MASSTWVVSGGQNGGGVVASTAVSGSTAYLGGNFTYVGPPTGSFVAADSAGSARLAVAGRRRQRLRRRAGRSQRLLHRRPVLVGRDEAREQPCAHQFRRHARHRLERKHERHGQRARRLGRHRLCRGRLQHRGRRCPDESRSVLRGVRRARDGVHRQRDGNGAASTRSRRRARCCTSAASSRRSAAAAGRTWGRRRRHGHATSWIADTDGAVYALAAGSGVVYAGGDFEPGQREHVAQFRRGVQRLDRHGHELESERRRRRRCARAVGHDRLRRRSVRHDRRRDPQRPRRPRRPEHGPATSWNPNIDRPDLSRSRSRGRPSTRAGRSGT